MLPMVACAVVACTGADDKSGGDSERYQAKPLQMAKLEADAVDISAGDATDWKVLDLQDTGYLTVELVLDNANAEVSLSLFDRFGKPVARASHRKGEPVQLKLTTDVGIGRYFVRVQADKGSEATGYSIRAVVK